MNKKLTVRTENGRVRYCVLDAQQDFEKQLSEVLGIQPGYGRAVRVYEEEICVEDYYSNETIGSFAVLAIEDTALPVSLRWADVT